MDKTKSKTEIKIDEKGRVYAVGTEELKGLKVLIRVAECGSNSGLCVNIGSCRV